MVEIDGIFLRTSSVEATCIYVVCTWSWSWDYDIILNKGLLDLTKLNTSTGSIYRRGFDHGMNIYGFGRNLSPLRRNEAIGFDVLSK